MPVRSTGCSRMDVNMYRLTQVIWISFKTILCCRGMVLVHFTSWSVVIVCVCVCVCVCVSEKLLMFVGQSPLGELTLN